MLSSSQQETAIVEAKIKQLFTDLQMGQFLPFYSQSKIIIRPNTIWELLILFESFEGDEIKAKILNELTLCLDAFPLNSLTLSLKTPLRLPNNKKQNVIDELIKLYLTHSKVNPQLASNILNIVDIFYRHNKLEKSQINVIYSDLAQKFYDQTLDAETLHNSLLLLNKILIQQNPKYSEPQSYFYFTGINSGLQACAKNQTPWLFSSGFGVGVWFYLEEANEGINDAEEMAEYTGRVCPKLFTIHCQGHGGFEAYFIGQNLYYRVLPVNYSEPAKGSNGVLIGVFQPKTWYYLGLEHEKVKIGRSHVNIVINTEQKKSISIEFPKITSNVAITKFVIGENMLGRISSVVFFKSPVTSAKLTELNSLFNLGLQTNHTIKNLYLPMEKLLDKVLLLYTPIRAAGEVCYDILGTYHGALLENSGFINKDFTQFRLEAFGGVSSILPFFYFLRFVDNEKYPLLDELLRIVILLLRNKTESQLEAAKMGFFKVIGQLLVEAQKNFLTFESIELFAEIKNCLNNLKLTEEMFTGILWRTELYDGVNEDVKAQAFKYIRTIYLQNSKYYFALFGVKNILDLVMEKYDPPFKQKTVLNLHQEWNSTKSPDYQAAQQTLQPILNLIEVALFSGGELGIEAVTNIINVLTFKCSSFLHLLILKLFQSSFNKVQDQIGKMYLKILVDTKSIRHFLYLMTNTSCLDLKSICIKFINLIASFSPDTHKESVISHYLSSIIWSNVRTRAEKKHEHGVPSSPKLQKELSAPRRKSFDLVGNKKSTPSSMGNPKPIGPDFKSASKMLSTRRHFSEAWSLPELDFVGPDMRILRDEASALAKEQQLEDMITLDEAEKRKEVIARLKSPSQSPEMKRSVQATEKEGDEEKSTEQNHPEENKENDPEVSQRETQGGSGEARPNVSLFGVEDNLRKSENQADDKHPQAKPKSLRKKPNLAPIPINKNSPEMPQKMNLSNRSENSLKESLDNLVETEAGSYLNSEDKVSETLNSQIPDTISESFATKQTSSPQTIKIEEGKREELDDEKEQSEVAYDVVYNSLLEWLLHKKPSALEAKFVVDDLDKISSVSATLVMIKFYKHASEFVKQKMIQDLYMLVKCNSANCVALLGVPEFQYFLLDTLLPLQVTLFQEELRGASAAIWELGVKTYTLLSKFALLNQPESHHRFQLMFAWTANQKRTGQAAPKDEEKACYYLVRHLWQNFLENIEDSCNMIYPFAHSNLWNNLVQLTFYTEEILSSAFNFDLSEITKWVEESENFSPFRNLITRFKKDEKIPKNYNTLIKTSDWVDSNLCLCLLKALAPLWNNFVFQKFKEDEKLTQTQKLEKKLSLLMDGIQSEKQSQLFEWFFTESKESNIPNRGYFLKIIVQLLVCFAEESVRSKNLENTKITCQQIESLLIVLEVLGENIGERYLSPLRRSFIIASILYLLQTLYRLLDITPEEDQLRIPIVSSINNSIMHLMGAVDYIHQRTGKSGSIHSNMETVPTSKQTFSMITHDIINIHFSLEDEPIITIQMIKNLKFKDFTSLNAIIFSEEWRYTFVKSEKINQVIHEYYQSSLKEITIEVSRKIESRAINQALKNNQIQKRNEEFERKYGMEIVETALRVYEQEDEKRQENIANEEVEIREAKNLWKKFWKRVRVFNGQWRHPQLYDQEDFKYNADKEAYDKMKKNLLFTHKIAKYETRARARPFLKIKLIEPKYVDEYDEVLKNKRAKQRHIINTLRPNVFFTTTQSIEDQNSKKFSFTDIKKNLTKTFKSIATGGNPQSPWVAKGGSNKPMSPNSPNYTDSANREELILVKKCQWIKTLTIRIGHLQVTSNKLSFIVDGLDQKENHVAFLKFSLPDDRRIVKEWPLENIEEIQMRRYIFRKSALEIMMTDGSTYLFNFTEADAEEISSVLTRFKKNKCPNLIYYGTLDPRKVLDKSGITKKWMNYEISNFEYVIRLNALSGRSYKDLTQYPVFPWIISNYITDVLKLDDPTSFRDLSKTLGALGSQERIDTFVERFESNDNIDDVPAFHFGSHYSSPAIILQYLIRLAPYTQGAIQLQSGRFDLADRLFASMQESYKGAIEEIADVRELLPEFYFLPDFLLNREKLDFGVTQYGYRVHHVVTPKWCNDNPYLFIALLREALESERVSRSLHNWIDLIFGYKQTGKEAEKALNVFYYMTYEGKVDLSMLDDPSTKISYESQIVHFGQTPSQLFFKPHPQRPYLDARMRARVFAEALNEVNVYRPTTKIKGEKKSSTVSTHLNKNTKAVLAMNMVGDNKLVGFRKDGRIIYSKWVNFTKKNEATTAGPFKWTREKKKLERFWKGKYEIFDHFDNSVTYISHPIAFINSAKFMISGGYWDGKLALYSIENDGFVSFFYAHSDTITSLILDEKEEFLITGSKSGECIVWSFLPESSKIFQVKFQYYDHDDMINHIFISNDLRLFATASNDGKVNIYHSVTGQLMRTIFHPSNLPVEMVVLSSCPLPSVIFFSSEDKTLYSYSINGRLLDTSQEEAAHTLAPKIIRDLNFMEFLVYGNEKGEVFVRELPFLNLRKKWEISFTCPIFSITLSRDNRYLFCGCGDGKLVVLTDPNLERIEEDLAHFAD